MIYANRQEAGQALVEGLRSLNLDEPLVLALARGGVVVGVEVARALEAPLEALVARKIGAPQEPELGIGAIAEGGALFVDRELAEKLGVRAARLEVLAADALAEVDRRVQVYRQGRPLPPLRHQTVILVDDGVATGSTLHAAMRAVRRCSPRSVVVAVPVGAESTLTALAAEADEVICPMRREDLLSIGSWYADFAQVSDGEVLALLEESRADRRAEREVWIPADGATLSGDLTLPERPEGLVLFAHGSGSSRHSPRNRFVAATLQAAGLATLLFDLLTPEEERRDIATGRLRGDVGLLARRLSAATAWARTQPSLAHLPRGYFGASTGAAAALIAAALEPDVLAVVSRGGRPDLAGDWLSRVRAPTLCVVGGADEEVLQLNAAALKLIPVEKRLEIVPGATHLFAEPGALEAVAMLAAQWFEQHLLQSMEATARGWSVIRPHRG